MADFQALKRNIIALVQEFQVKLGGSDDAIRLYYPPESLARTLGADVNEAELQALLQEFAAFARDDLGEVTASGEGGLFCLFVPKAGVRWVREALPEPVFLKAFIAAIARHDCTIGELISLFRGFDPGAVCEAIDGGEFDYLLYFPAGEPDDFRYCVHFEGPHAIYHRFTPQDYAALGFPPGRAVDQA